MIHCDFYQKTNLKFAAIYAKSCCMYTSAAAAASLVKRNVRGDVCGICKAITIKGKSKKERQVILMKNCST